MQQLGIWRPLVAILSPTFLRGNGTSFKKKLPVDQIIYYS